MSDSDNVQTKIQENEIEEKNEALSAPVLSLRQRADMLGVGYLESVDVKEIDKKNIALIPEETARKFRMVSVGVNEGVADVLMENAENIDALNALRFLAKEKKMKFSVLLTHPSVIDAVLSRYESAERALKEVVETLNEEDLNNDKLSQKKEEDLSNREVFIRDAPVAKLVEVVIRHAIDGKASDIHIEPSENDYRIRYRVDGMLYSSLVLPKNVGRTVVARIKILADLKIDEKRKPQDGRFFSETGGKRVDFRVSTFPVVEGEKVVLRVLDKDTSLGDLKDLGLMGRNLELFTRRIHDPYGIILITGPTGSGKSTTLYGFLKILNVEGTNIVTLEDPVEYLVSGVNQSQIRPDIGYTFANGLRSILRQDPNVIMVGEIRDSETAELAIHAALTGHLVFSTLHTNDAMGAIPRLLDMGIENFLLSASLRVVAAQRLARRICKHCLIEIEASNAQKKKIRAILEEVSQEELTRYGISEEMFSDRMILYHGSGCNECGKTGYKGRIAIYEALEVDSVLQGVLNDDAGHAENRLAEAVRAQGMVSMKQDGVLKVLLGLTTLEEVERITEGSRSVGGDVEDDLG